MVERLVKDIFGKREVKIKLESVVDRTKQKRERDIFKTIAATSDNAENPIALLLFLQMRLRNSVSIETAHTFVRR